MSECGKCIQFLTSWEGDIVPKNFFCQLQEGHKGKHRIRGVTGDNQYFMIEWEKPKKKKSWFTNLTH